MRDQDRPTIDWSRLEVGAVVRDRFGDDWALCEYQPRPTIVLQRQGNGEFVCLPDDSEDLDELRVVS